METKIALVTGASRGIGRAVAVALAKNNFHVLINFRNRQADAEETLAQIRQGGGNGELLPFDVSDVAACEKAIEQILKMHKRIDVLVNNAGIRNDTLFPYLTAEQWSNVINTNLNSFFNVTRPIAKQMAFQRKGRIVTIASTSGQTGVAGQVNYSAAKAGVIGASKSLARELAKRNVTVNVLAPGFIETEMLEGLPREQILSQIPAGRLGTPEEVAATAAFLCSDSAGYINGAVININGALYT